MKTILIIVLITMACVAGFGAISKFTDASATTTTSQNKSDATSLSASISGQVVKPGTYKLKAGATLVDLIEAAGGTNTNADELAFFPDVVLENKGEYYIAPIYDNTSACATSPIIKCNLNQASAEELNKIAGFTKTASAAVVSFRNSTKFETLEQVQDVSGIGKATYISVRDKLTLKKPAE